MTKPDKQPCSRDKYPPEFRAEIVKEALETISNGISLLDFCNGRKLTFSTVWGWIESSDPDHFARIRAMTIGGDALAFQVLQIIDDPTIDARHKHIRAEYRMRLAGKWNARYGDRTDVNVNIRPAPDWSQLSPSARAEVRALLERSVTGHVGAGNGPLIEQAPDPSETDENTR